MTHHTKTATRLMLGSAMALGLSALAAQADIRFWTTEEQPERLAKQEEMAAAFTAETGVAVEVIPVTESELGTRATAAFAAGGDLPDVIYHTLQYALPWAEAGILDTDAATEVVEALGQDTFAPPGAIAMAAVEDGVASVPVDGWTQMIVYRKDLFDQMGLAAPPTSYDAVRAAIAKLHNPPGMYGFVAATKVDENFMSQVLEHVFLANGVSPVGGADGFKPLEEGPTIEVLEFYRDIAKASPPGELYWKQSRELYFAGQAAMIIWSPFILDELAGLRDSAPRQPSMTIRPHAIWPPQPASSRPSRARPTRMARPGGVTCATSALRRMPTPTRRWTLCSIRWMPGIPPRYPSRPKASSRCAAAMPTAPPPLSRPGRCCRSAWTARPPPVRPLCAGND